MKKIFYTFVILAITLTSCENNQIQVQTEPTITLTAEQQKMRNALESTTNILLDMISSNQAYLDELNKVIIAGSSEYLEDRVMLKDLFESTATSSMLRVKANSERFTSDFKNSFAKSKPQKVSGNTDIDSNIFYNSDSLIQYLIDNNVGIYCPIPIEYYDANNRIPAITYHPITNDSINVGYLCNKNELTKEVIINQAYNNLHPVWIVKPIEKSVENTSKPNLSKSANGYEVSVCKIYCKEYNEGLFDGDLELHIVRINPSNVTYNSTTNTYSGGIMTDLSFSLPRKYVSDARNNYWKGWYDLNLVWDTDWNTSENSNIIYVYEWDSKGTKQNTIPLNTYDENGKVLANLGSVTITTQSQDATIGLSEWSRYWFMNIINNGNPEWYWQHDAGAIQYKIDNNNIIKLSPSFLLTMKVREY